MKELCKIDSARSEVAPITFADVDITQPLAACQNGLHKIGFLNIHVIGIEVHDNIGRIDFIQHAERLGCCIEQIAFVAIHDFEAEGDKIAAEKALEYMGLTAGTPLLEVAVDNAPAQRLYATYDFEPVGLRRGYYQPSNTDALVMMRSA